jgi:hypothetical protein
MSWESIVSPHYGKFIAYYRVSTDQQGKSGLGLDARRKAVKHQARRRLTDWLAGHLETDDG